MPQRLTPELGSPNLRYPSDAAALGKASLVLRSLGELDARAVERSHARRGAGE